MSADPVKSAFCSIVNSRRLGEEPSTALSVDTDFEPAPNVKVLSATLFLYRAFPL